MRSINVESCLFYQDLSDENLSDKLALKNMEMHLFWASFACYFTPY